MKKRHQTQSHGHESQLFIFCIIVHGKKFISIDLLHTLNDHSFYLKTFYTHSTILSSPWDLYIWISPIIHYTRSKNDLKTEKKLFQKYIKYTNISNISPSKQTNVNSFKEEWICPPGGVFKFIFKEKGIRQ